MSYKNQKQSTLWSDERNNNLVDANRSKLKSHHKEEQLEFLQVSSKNGYGKKSNEIAIKQSESSKKVSNRGLKWLNYSKLKFIINSLFKRV